MIAASVDDYRELARRKLPHFLFEYVDGGSFAEQTLARNVADLRALSLRQRVLRDVSQLELGVDLLGRRARLPLALAPIGLAGLCARRGELQAARAAEAAGVPFTLSTVGCCSLGEVARGVREPFWFQLYMMRDRGFMKALLDEAEAARCSALVFTVDMAVPGSRYRDVRSGLAGGTGLGGALRRVLQAAQRPAWAWDVGLLGRPHELGNVAPLLAGQTGIEDFFAWMRENFDPSVTWRDLEWVRSRWRGPLLVKGVLDAPDAIAAVDRGADGVVVSNHGGRQLDGVLSTARALPRIADALRGRALVLADGGIRSGLDVLRMLALGAHAVLLGRAWVYALGARGEAGVAHVLELIERELRVAMALTGVTRVADVDRSVLDEAT
ncbi:MAG TPA: L-lactate dehydrogenase [Myxococcota bacterium]|nr:L-lactate dehydrogenase [Myxococcota bacterium]